MSFLEVRDLIVQFGRTKVVDEISFALEGGEVLGIVGESGSGKTMTALAIMRLLPQTAEFSGLVLFENQDLFSLTENQMEKIRGEKIAMIFQDPVSSLNPVVNVGEQIKEMLEFHRPDIKKRDQREFVVNLLRKVNIPDAEKRYANFPHELSGGMNQRIVIAMALAVKPKIIIADEPTTALDVTVQAKILDILTLLSKEMGISLVLITHNWGIIAEYVDKVLVMRKGKIVEQGLVSQIFSEPADPYTKHLLEVVPRL